MKKPKTVLVDLDNTLVQTNKALVAELTQLGIPQKDDAQPSEYVRDMYEKKYHDIIHFVRTHMTLYAKVKPTNGSQVALNQMLDSGLDIRICTSFTTQPMPNYLDGKQDCISQLFGEEWLARTIHTKDKTYVIGDFLIDDKPQITGANIPRWRPIVFDKEYNQDVNGPRLNGWGNWKTDLEPYLN